MESAPAKSDSSVFLTPLTTILGKTIVKECGLVKAFSQHELKRDASELGANAVIGLQMTTNIIKARNTQGFRTRWSMYGMAVKVEDTK